MYYYMDRYAFIDCTPSKADPAPAHWASAPRFLIPGSATAPPCSKTKASEVATRRRLW